MIIIQERTYDRNNLIDVLRLICAYMVVAIHTHPLQECSKLGTYILASVIPQIAVPFFFVVSGFFFYNKVIGNSDSVERCVVKQIKNVLKEYCLWSVLYIVVNFMNMIIGENFTLKGFIADTIIRFFFAGTFYHLWYMVALIVSMCIVGIFLKIDKAKLAYMISMPLYTIGVLGGAYASLANNIPIVKQIIQTEHFTWIRRMFLMGLPLFLLGVIINNVVEKLKISGLDVIVLAVINSIEIIMVNVLNINDNIILTFTLYPLVMCIVIYCIQHPLNTWGIIGKVCREISNIVYFIHPLMVIVVLKLKFSSLITFVMSCVFSSLFGILIFKIKQCHVKS